MNNVIASGNLLVNAVLGLIALALLVLAANEAVKRLCGLADYFNLSATFMGMTVASLATSIPEISSHITGSVGILRGGLGYQVGSSIVLGSNIGSDVVQQTLIMGLVVFLAGTLYFRRYFLTKNMVPMIGTTVMCIILGWDRTYSRLDGAILFGTFILYMGYLYQDERKYYQKPGAGLAEPMDGEEHDVPKNRREAMGYALVALAAMALTIVSATIVLQITEFIVAKTNIGGSFIGVITLGLASALPELTTALAGVRNKAHGISLGTLVGSNITNPLVAIGLGALTSTYYVPRGLVYWDLPWETLTGALLWAILWFRKGKLGRWGAIYLMGLYVVYITCRAAWFMVD
jgi:cation:H+ antiporter